MSTSYLKFSQNHKSGSGEDKKVYTSSWTDGRCVISIAHYAPVLTLHKEFN